MTAAVLLKEIAAAQRRVDDYANGELSAADVLGPDYATCPAPRAAAMTRLRDELDRAVRQATYGEVAR